MPAAFFLQSQNWLPNKRCSTSYQATPPRWPEPKTAWQNPKRRSPPALPNPSSLSTQCATQKCLQRKSLSIRQMPGCWTLAGSALALPLVANDAREWLAFFLIQSWLQLNLLFGQTKVYPRHTRRYSFWRISKSRLRSLRHLQPLRPNVVSGGTKLSP